MNPHILNPPILLKAFSKLSSSVLSIGIKSFISLHKNQIELRSQVIRDIERPAIIQMSKKFPNILHHFPVVTQIDF